MALLLHALLALRIGLLQLMRPRKARCAEVWGNERQQRFACGMPHLLHHCCHQCCDACARDDGAEVGAESGWLSQISTLSRPPRIRSRSASHLCDRSGSHDADVTTSCRREDVGHQRVSSTSSSFSSDMERSSRKKSSLALFFTANCNWGS